MIFYDLFDILYEGITKKIQGTREKFIYRNIRCAYVCLMTSI